MKRFECEVQEMRSEKSETGSEDFECSHPISHFSHDILTTKSLVWPREMGNGIQTRILATEVWPRTSARDTPSEVKTNYHSI